MSNNLISVITPVYNVEKYLDEYFKSITSQTYKNLEIIIVDDLSTDRSGSICDSWASKDSRIKVIHKSQNEGVAAARNTGLENISGDYLYSMDPDDIASPYLIETLYNNLKKYDADVSLCHEVAFKETQNNPIFDSVPLNEIVLETRKQYLEHFVDPFTGPIGWLWNKLYKRDVINNIRFQNFKVLEDITFNASASMNIKKAVWCNDKLYGYRVRESSLTGAGKIDVTMEQAKAWLYSYNIFKDNAPDFADRYMTYLLGKFASLRAQSRAHYGKESEQRMKEFYNEVYDKNISALSSINNTEKIKLMLARHAFGIFYLNAKRHV